MIVGTIEGTAGENRGVPAGTGLREGTTDLTTGGSVNARCRAGTRDLTTPITPGSPEALDLDTPRWEVCTDRWAASTSRGRLDM